MKDGGKGDKHYKYNKQRCSVQCEITFFIMIIDQ